MGKKAVVCVWEDNDGRAVDAIKFIVQFLFDERERASEKSNNFKEEKNKNIFPLPGCDLNAFLTNL
jgi:hypothetical protein